jgi:hypothetical protein
VNLAHRLLKNTVRTRIGPRPYLLITEAAAVKLELGQLGMAHHEEYADVGPVDTRIVDMAEAAGIALTTWVGPLPGSEAWRQVRISDS